MWGAEIKLFFLSVTTPAELQRGRALWGAEIFQTGDMPI